MCQAVSHFIMPGTQQNALGENTLGGGRTVTPHHLYFSFSFTHNIQIQIVFVGSCPRLLGGGASVNTAHKVGAPQEWALQNWGWGERAREQNQD